MMVICMYGKGSVEEAVLMRKADSISRGVVVVFKVMDRGWKVKVVVGSALLRMLGVAC